MYRLLLLPLMVCFCTLALHAQDLSAYEKKIFVSGPDTLRYRLLLPENFDASKKYPLVIFLHGSGERGRDNELQLVHGGSLFLREDLRKQYPAIVVFPQCPDNDRWANYRLLDSAGRKSFVLQSELPETKPMKLVEGLMDQLQKEYRVNTKQVYVGGLSMGGMGTFELVRRHPKVFAAAFPICGAADPQSAASVKKVSWWIFHGAKDDVVPPNSSIEMAAALSKENADVRFTLYPEANHNSWDSAFAEKDLFPWLFSKHR
jgi:predicted peptidase